MKFYEATEKLKLIIFVVREYFILMVYVVADRQRRSATELRRCLEYVSQHAHVLESVLRGAAGAGPGEVPLSAALVRQAAALQRCMAQCVANAERIRHLLAATHQPQMDTMLAKMVSNSIIFSL